MRFTHGLSFVALASLLLFVAQAPAQVARDQVVAQRLIKDGQQERVAALVEMLASKNPAPEESRPGYVRYPKDYDKAKQAVVYLAVQQLLAEGSAAFDALIDHLDDKRYSYTIESGAGQFNHSVGVACYKILWRNVLCYDLEIHLLTMDQWKIDPWWGGKEDKFDGWLKKNKHRPLWELQTEAIDRVIKFFETVDREKASTVHPDAREKMPLEVFERKRKENLEILRSMRASINANKQPYRPKTIDNYQDNMRDLPWPTRVLDK